MIGAWSKFGEGPLPQDGEAIVFVELFGAGQALIDGVAGRAVCAVYKFGSVHTQDGAIMPVPYGCEWTSLPHPSAKVP